MAVDRLKSGSGGSVPAAVLVSGRPHHFRELQMLLPKFTLAQTLRLTLLAACGSVVLAAAWQGQAWAWGLTLAAGLALGVALFSAAVYWVCLGIGRLLLRAGR
jgi:hypothetical protein